MAAGGEVGCTGVIIRPRVVLTAARCLADHPDTVLVGRSAAEGVHVGVAQAVPSHQAIPSVRSRDQRLRAAGVCHLSVYLRRRRPARLAAWRAPPRAMMGPR
ncbi:trypsin-like serine protease [Sorangium sp. So ce260]|uniref:trypsin-like serine protease n=1 Tax=Sorangium sp. So ce260 TaxID=3133291 RepID=UPI003F635A26